MLKIALLNLPFASASLPSIALTQLRSMLQKELGSRVRADVLYLNHDFADYLGVGAYQAVADSVRAVTSGLGDWFFREQAFPQLPDNTEAYLRRHYPQREPELLSPLLARRPALGELLEELIDVYRLDTYDIVGFTSMFSQNLACFAMARKLKERAPEVVTLMGGANCETTMGRIIAKNVDAIDFVFSGPALKSFPSLVSCLLDGDEDGCHRIPGVLSRKKLAHPPATAERPEIGEELGIEVEIPLDYDDFLDSLDSKVGDSVRPEILFETSRGCWWGERAHCTFCGLNGMTMSYRALAPEKALESLRNLIDRYHPRASHFQAVDNIMPREYLLQVFEHLRPPEGVSIFYEVKADLKPAELEVLAQAGVTQIQPGIEALATSTLSLMRKGTTSFQNLKFLKSCLIHGIKPHWNLLIGFPREPEEVYRKYCDDLPRLVHLPPPTGTFPVRFDRFSPYHREAEGYGLRLKPCDFYGMLYPFSREDLEQFAYFFIDQNFGAEYVFNTAQWYSKLSQGVQEWRSLWFGDGGASRPQLFFQDRGQTVKDSRSGRMMEHRLGEESAQVLRQLSQQLKVERLAERLPDLSATAIEAALSDLRDRGLIFQEGVLFLSLVLEEGAGEAGEEEILASSHRPLEIEAVL